jgi:hypothetical protein
MVKEKQESRRQKRIRRGGNKFKHLVLSKGTSGLWSASIAKVRPTRYE